MDLEKQKRKKSEEVEVVDTKWSWAIAFSCCFINFLLYGVARLSGMMMVAVLDAFHTNRARASLPFSIASSIRSLSGFFVGYFGQRFGLRNIIVVGCCLASLGAGLCFFVTDIKWMIVCWGGIFGIGYGLATCLLPLAITQNFNRYRGIASGIAYSGSYIGSFVFPSLFVKLLDVYGISGTLLIISGTFLNGCVVSFLFRKPPKKIISKHNDSELRNTGAIRKELNVTQRTESLKKLWFQLWKKIKSFFLSLKENESRTISNYSSIYFISPQPLNHQTIKNVSCCELISYRDSSINQKNKCLLDCYQLPCHCNKSIRYNFPQRMKRAKYKRKITRIKFSLGANITRKQFSFNKQFFYFPLENARLVSFRRRKVSFNCIKMATNEMHPSAYSDLPNLLSTYQKSNDSSINFSRLCKAVEAKDSTETSTNRTIKSSLEHELPLHDNDHEPYFSKSNQEEVTNNFRKLTNDDNQFASNGSEFGDEVQSIQSSRTFKCNVLKGAGKCLFGWCRVYADPMFMVIAITMSLHAFVLVCMITIIEDFAKDIGIRECRVHYVLMVLSIADLIGSLTLGFITDRGFLSSCNFIILCFFGMFVTQICISKVRYFSSLLTMVGFYGLFESGAIITFPLLIAHYIPPKKQAVAVSSSNILSSPTVLLVPLVIGYFRDGNGCYRGAFNCLGLTCLGCCCTWLVASCIFAKCRSDKTLCSKT